MSEREGKEMEEEKSTQINTLVLSIKSLKEIAIQLLW